MCVSLGVILSHCVTIKWVLLSVHAWDKMPSPSGFEPTELKKKAVLNVAGGNF